MDAMAILAQEMNDLETSRRCIMDAAELRGVGKDKPADLPKEFYDRRPVLYTMKLRDIGLPEASRSELGAMIDKMDITEKEKGKIRRDAQIEDIPFELLPSDAQD